jgi:hypothetical protein
VSVVDVVGVLIVIVAFFGAVHVLGVPWIVIVVVAILAGCTIVASWGLTVVRRKSRRGRT